MPGPPLSTPLSHLLIAFTIEFDNELDHRMTKAELGHRLPISMVMWSNFMRFVVDGITVGELPGTAGLPKSRVLSTLGGMERWRYVFVGANATGPPPKSRRDGWGSARALRREWFVRPTPVGRKTQEIAPPLFAEIESRWEERFGTDTIDALRQALRSELSLPLTANVVRVLDGTGMDVRDIPAAAGVSKEATSMAVNFLRKNGHVSADAKRVRLTTTGLEAQASAPRHYAHVERRWRAHRLNDAAAGILDQRGQLSEGLRPYADGWRARKRYIEQTNAVIDDPITRLPHYPMVLHRGGWPDGS